MTGNNSRARPGNGGPRSGSGRPALESGRRVNVTLDEATIELAQQLGNGNLSAGLREAVRRATENKP